MAISTITTENGETLWSVYVNVRSKTSPGFRAQRRSRRVKTRREAERLERDFLRECEREIAEKESRGQSWKMLVGSWAEHLKQESNDLAETTRIDYVAALNNHTQVWMNRAATSITSFDIKELLNQLKADGKGSEFQKKFKNMLTRVFNFGIEKRLIRGLDRAPTHGVKLDRPQENKPEILTLSEIKNLLVLAKENRNPWYPIWAMALLTGMRNGELYALNWGDINFEAKSIMVEKSYNKRTRQIKSTKGGYWRTVPISGELNELLMGLKRTAADRPSVLPHLREWQMGLQAQELRKFCLLTKLPSIRFHALRACFATQLIRVGVPAIKLQKICGWKDLKTMQRYIRLAGIEVDGATDSMKLLPELSAETLSPNRNSSSTFEQDDVLSQNIELLATALLPSHLSS